MMQHLNFCCFGSTCVQLHVPPEKVLHLAETTVMSKSAISVFVFGLYLLLLGLCLMIIPNMLLTAFAVPATSEVWIRVVGLLLMALSVYYIVAARLELVPVLKITMYIRCSIILFFTAFVLLDYVTPSIILFAVIDLAGGIWTYAALKQEGKLHA